MQHDMNIANGSGSAVRTDLNNALVSLAGLSSGSSEPGTMFAYMLWADTTTGLLKIRNAANSNWVTVGTLASANLGLLPLAGGTMTGNLLFTDATYDIGASGATRPRNGFFSGNVTANGVLCAAATLTGGTGWNATHSSTTNLYGLVISNTKAHSASNDCRISLTVRDSAGNDDPAFVMTAGLSSTTSGAEVGAVNMSSMVNGSQSSWLTFTGSTSPGVTFPAAGALGGAGGAISAGFIGAGTQYGIVLRPTSDTTHFIEFYNAANSSQGSISDNGSGTISYNAFVGSHDSQLQGGHRSEILSGTIMETVDEICDFGFTEELLPKCKVSDTPGSPRAYGVFFRWDERDDVDEVQKQTVHTDVPVTEVINSRLVRRVERRTEQKEITETQLLVNEDGSPLMVEQKTGLFDEEGNEITRLVQAEAVVPVTVRRAGNADLSVAGLGQFHIRMKAGQPLQTGYVESAGDGTGRFQADQTRITRATVAEVNAAVVIKTYDDGSFLMPARLMKG